MYTEIETRAAQRWLDAQLPEDEPDIHEILDGSDTSKAGTAFFERLYDNGKLRYVVNYLADDYETTAELLRIIEEHAEPDGVLAKTYNRLVEEL